MNEETMTASDLADRIEALISAESVDAGFAAIHVQSGAELALNAQELFPTASVFKVPVMVEVFRQAEAGRFAIGDRLPLEDSHKTLASGVLQTLDGGLTPTIHDLLTLMTIVSDNTATTMLVDLVGVDRINATMTALGLPDIVVTLNVHQMFLHTWHLPLDRVVDFKELRAATRGKPMDYNSLTFARTRENTVASAADMAKLMAMIGRRQIVSAAACEEMLLILNRQQYTSRVPRYLPWGAARNKTGTMRGLRNDSGLLMRGEDDAIAYALFTFDPTELGGNNSRLLVERDTRVASMMGEIGAILWDEFGR
jgi:beta-lactamase class A